MGGWSTQLLSPLPCIRLIFHQTNSSAFPYGTKETSIKFTLLHILKSTNTITKSQFICSQYNHQGRVVGNNQASVIHATDNIAGLIAANWINNITGPSYYNCSNYSTDMI